MGGNHAVRAIGNLRREHQPQTNSDDRSIGAGYCLDRFFAPRVASLQSSRARLLRCLVIDLCPGIAGAAGVRPRSPGRRAASPAGSGRRAAGLRASGARQRRRSTSFSRRVRNAERVRNGPRSSTALAAGWVTPRESRHHPLALRACDERLIIDGSSGLHVCKGLHKARTPAPAVAREQDNLSLSRNRATNLRRPIIL